MATIGGYAYLPSNMWTDPKPNPTRNTLPFVNQEEAKPLLIKTAATLTFAPILLNTCLHKGYNNSQPLINHESPTLYGFFPIPATST